MHEVVRLPSTHSTNSLLVSRFYIGNTSCIRRCRSPYISLGHLKTYSLNTPQVGLKPTTFGLEVQRAIHCATRALSIFDTHHHHMHDALQTDLTHSLHTLVHRIFDRHRAVLTTVASAYISRRDHARARQVPEYSLSK